MSEPALHLARILIVDDGADNVRLLESLLQKSGYTQLRSTTDPLQALALFQEYQPDLILLDLHMPHLDGFGVMEQIRPLIPSGSYLPIVMLTGDLTPEARQRALQVGARDFLTKPFDPTEILLRIRNLLETRALHVQLREQNRVLDEKVRERTHHLEEAQRRLLEAEAEKKRFYCDVIRAVTQDKLHLVEPEEIPVEGERALEISLEDPSGYSRLRRELQELASRAEMRQDAADDLVLATGEAVTNAIKHAQRGRCEVYLSDDRLMVRVVDQGKGIRHEDLPASILVAGFSTQISLGMGYTVMLHSADCVWLATSPDGTVVQLAKWIRPEEHPAASPLSLAMERFDELAWDEA